MPRFRAPIARYAIRFDRVFMTDREARRDALSTWFMEFSVLWAVFPLLDSLVESRPLDWFVRWHWNQLDGGGNGADI